MKKDAKAINRKPYLRYRLIRDSLFRGSINGTVTTLGVCLLISSGVQAASFQILEQSPAHLGTAFAGTASNPQDASTVFFNPAAMTTLEGKNLTVGGNIIATRAEFSDNGSTVVGSKGETKEIAAVPNLYLTQQLNHQWSLGFGINAPFGLASRYEEDWIGRYLATDSELQVINVAGTLAFVVNDQLSLGLGINYQRAEVTLENQIDSTLGVAPSPTTDSAAKIQGDDDDIVLDASILWRPNTQTSLGLSWRQGGSFTLTGDAEFDLNPACTPGAGFPTGAPPAPTTGTLCAGALTSLQGKSAAPLELPDTLTVSGSYWFNEHLAIHGDIAWTQWSSIDTVSVTNANNGTVVDQLDLAYNDTQRIAFGATYNFRDWTWRAGLAFDEAPQTSARLNTPRIPDGNRAWFSTGFNYQFSPTMSVDLAFTHIAVEDAPIFDVDETTGAVVDGEFESSVSIVGAQFNWRF